MLEVECLKLNMEFSVDQSSCFMFLGIALKNSYKLFSFVVGNISKLWEYVRAYSLQNDSERMNFNRYLTWNSLKFYSGGPQMEHKQ